MPCCCDSKLSATRLVLLRRQPQKSDQIRQKQIFRNPPSRIEFYRLQSLYLGLKSTGYFFGATRKSFVMLYLEDSFTHIQNRAPEGRPKWPIGTTFWSKSSKCVFSRIFRFARFKGLEKPFFWIYGSGGCCKRVGAQKSQNRLRSRFSRFCPNRPSWPGVQNDLRFSSDEQKYARSAICSHF